MKFANNRSARKLLYGINLIIILFLFHNCTVYRGSSVTIDSAIDQNTKVVVHTEKGEKLKFKKLLKSDQDLIGVVSKQKTIDYLQEKGFDYEQYGKFRHYLIDSLEIDKIYPKNKTVSTLVNVGVSLLVVSTIITIGAAVIFLSSWGM